MENGNCCHLLYLPSMKWGRSTLLYNVLYSMVCSTPQYLTVLNSTWQPALYSALLYTILHYCTIHNLLMLCSTFCCSLVHLVNHTLQNLTVELFRPTGLYFSYGLAVAPPPLQKFEMAQSVSEFHITSHLLCWASGGGATNSPSHVLHMGVSYSR